MGGVSAVCLFIHYRARAEREMPYRLPVPGPRAFWSLEAIMGPVPRPFDLILMRFQSPAKHPCELNVDAAGKGKIPRCGRLAHLIVSAVKASHPYTLSRNSGTASMAAINLTIRSARSFRLRICSFRLPAFRLQASSQFLGCQPVAISLVPRAPFFWIEFYL